MVPEGYRAVLMLKETTTYRRGVARRYDQRARKEVITVVVPQNSCVDPASCRSLIRQQRNKRLVDRRKPFRHARAP
jgi:hypothetical protein